MTSDLKHIYHEKYDALNDIIDNSDLIDEQENIDMPTGWSFICLDETINYYTENLNKDSVKN
uniref:Uncharacterized protein n=1 Tax=Polysiphonia urceolata TaxID=173545 RepID=A0A1Z1MBZ6_POLUR|nr:hypothetical protein [Polysiphonia stricta]ARW63500.1 hypothetical protein [Polysiphonia stricta]